MNKLAELRKRAGVSVSALAAEAGVTRQAIYAIEAGTYIPNTTVSLRIARVLAVTVDEIFCLESPAADRVDLAICTPDLRAGTPVQIASIDGKLIATRPSPPEWYLPSSHAVVESASAGRAKVRFHRPDCELDNRLVIAGCDPATSLLGRYLQRAGVEAILMHRNSAASLRLLKENRVHIAGSHLRTDANKARSHDTAVVSFATWQEGLVVAPGNPKKIKSIEDLARKDVRFINRERGAGTRALLDQSLRELHIKPSRLRGYISEAPGHLAAAAAVAEGRADCCIATEAAARALSLAFVPLSSARYDLFLYRSRLDLPAVRVLLDTITRSHFRRELTAVAAYDTAATGTRLH